MTVFTGEEWATVPLDRKIEIIISFLIDNVAYKLSIDNGVSKESAAEVFKGSKTYNLLKNPESKLFYEDIKYILEMYQNELDGDWKSWLEI